MKKQIEKTTTSLKTDKNNITKKELVFNFNPHRMWQAQKVLESVYDQELFGLGGSETLLKSIPHSNCLFYFCNNALRVSTVRFIKAKEFDKKETKWLDFYEKMSRLNNPDDFVYEIGIEIASDKLNFDFCVERFDSLEVLKKEIEKIKEKEFFFEQCINKILEKSEISNELILEIKNSDLLSNILTDLILDNWKQSGKEFGMKELKYLSAQLSKLDWISETKKIDLVIDSIEENANLVDKEVISDFFKDVCGNKFLSKLKKEEKTTTTFWKDFLNYHFSREESEHLDENLDESKKNDSFIVKKSRRLLL